MRETEKGGKARGEGEHEPKFRSNGLNLTATEEKKN